MIKNKAQGSLRKWGSLAIAVTLLMTGQGYAMDSTGQSQEETSTKESTKNYVFKFKIYKASVCYEKKPYNDPNFKALTGRDRALQWEWIRKPLLRIVNVKAAHIRGLREAGLIFRLSLKNKKRLFGNSYTYGTSKTFESVLKNKEEVKIPGEKKLRYVLKQLGSSGGRFDEVVYSTKDVSDLYDRQYSPAQIKHRYDVKKVDLWSRIAPNIKRFYFLQDPRDKDRSTPLLSMRYAAMNLNTARRVLQLLSDFRWPKLTSLTLVRVNFKKYPVKKIFDKMPALEKLVTHDVSRLNLAEGGSPSLRCLKIFMDTWTRGNFETGESLKFFMDQEILQEDKRNVNINIFPKLEDLEMNIFPNFLFQENNVDRTLNTPWIKNLRVLKITTDTLYSKIALEEHEWPHLQQFQWDCQKLNDQLKNLWGNWHVAYKEIRRKKDISSGSEKQVLEEQVFRYAVSVEKDK